jgi:hypothetical protein
MPPAFLPCGHAVHSAKKGFRRFTAKETLRPPFSFRLGEKKTVAPRQKKSRFLGARREPNALGMHASVPVYDRTCLCFSFRAPR